MLIRRMLAIVPITYTRIDYAIALLESKHRLTTHERRDIALLLRRWRLKRKAVT